MTDVEIFEDSICPNSLQSGIGSIGAGAIKDLISTIARALVENPKQLSVTEIEGSYKLILELKVAKSDIGKVIGKYGQTAGAIRTILGTVSGKTTKRVIFEILG